MIPRSTVRYVLVLSLRFLQRIEGAPQLLTLPCFGVPHHLARYGLKAHPARRKGLSGDRQRAIMLTTVKVLEFTGLDDALDILNTLITNDFLGKSRRK